MRLRERGGGGGGGIRGAQEAAAPAPHEHEATSERSRESSSEDARDMPLPDEKTGAKGLARLRWLRLRRKPALQAAASSSQRAIKLQQEQQDAEPEEKHAAPEQEQQQEEQQQQEAREAVRQLRARAVELQDSLLACKLARKEGGKDKEASKALRRKRRADAAELERVEALLNAMEAVVCSHAALVQDCAAAPPPPLSLLRAFAAEEGVLAANLELPAALELEPGDDDRDDDDRAERGMSSRDELDDEEPAAGAGQPVGMALECEEADAKAEWEMLERMETTRLVCRLLRQHGSNVLARSAPIEMDWFKRKMDASGFNAGSWERAVGCLEHFVAWRSFSPAAEEQWGRLEAVRVARSRFRAAQAQVSAHAKAVAKAEAGARDDGSGGSGGSGGRRASEALRDALRRALEYRETLRLELRERLEPFIDGFQPLGAEVAEVARQAKRHARRTERVLARLLPHLRGGGAELARRHAAATEASGADADAESVDERDAELPSAEQVRGACRAALLAERVWRARHDPQETAAASDRAAEQLRAAAADVFLVHPLAVGQARRRELEAALQTFRQEETARTTTDLSRNIPLRALSAALRNAGDYLHGIARQVSRAEEALTAARRELRALRASPQPPPACDLRAALAACRAARVAARAAQQPSAELEQRAQEAREDLEAERAAFVRVAAHLYPELLAQERPLLLATLPELEGVPQEAVQSEDEDSAAGAWVETPARGPAVAPLQRAHREQKGVRVGTACEAVGGRRLAVLRLDLGTRRGRVMAAQQQQHGAVPLLLPRAPSLLQAEAVFLDGHELCLAFPEMVRGSVQSWLAGTPSGMRPLATVRQLLSDVLAALARLQEDGRAHGALTPNNVFLSDAGRAVVGLPAWRVDRADARQDMRGVAELAELLTDDLDLADADRAAVVDFCAAAPSLDALAGLQHRLFVSEMERARECPICCETVPEAMGLACSSGEHFMCDECLEGHLRALSEEGNGAALRRHADHVPCFDPGCTSAPFHPKTVAEHVSSEAFDLYRAAVAREKERATVEALQRDFAAEMAKLRDMSLTDLTIEKHVAHVLNDIVTLKCPNGHAFVDFEGCFALQCATCQCHFCAWCLVDCGLDAHPHVGVCGENPTGGLFGEEHEFNRYHNGRRKRLVDAFWDTIVEEGDANVMRGVRDRVQPALQQLGVDASLRLPKAIRREARREARRRKGAK